MKITKIEKKNQKYRIYINEEYMFSLYFSELKKFNIETDNSISIECINEINNNIIKRGCNYMYNLLSRKDYTYNEYTNKLIKAGYKENQINIILSTFLDKGYIDDKGYVDRYLEQMKDKKSLMQIIYTLKNKGIEMDIIKDTISELDYDELEAAKRQLTKRLKNKDSLTYEDKVKNHNYLLRKGYKLETIRRLNQLNI